LEIKDATSGQAVTMQGVSLLSGNNAILGKLRVVTFYQSVAH